MFNDNLKNIRKSQNMTQEELASKLNVVRQTVSKWEKGLSVPDAEMLLKLAEALKVSVNKLLAPTTETDFETNPVAEQLAHINEQLIIKNRRTRRIWKTILLIIGTIIVVNIIILCSLILLRINTNPNLSEQTQTYESAEYIIEETEQLLIERETAPFIA